LSTSAFIIGFVVGYSLLDPAIGNEKTMIEYNKVLEKTNTFISAVLNNEDAFSYLSLTSGEINCLSSKNTTSNDDQNINSEHFVYTLENDRLFEQEITYVWMLEYRTFIRKFEIILALHYLVCSIDSKYSKQRLINRGC
jgi:hypothetical protein